MKIKAAIAGILALFAVAASASAQQFPVVPDRTVLGRIGVGGQSGPSQAIPFATMASQIFSLAPTLPVFHPSSGNLSGPGCLPASTIFWNVTENICSTADVWQLKSTDPSAVFTLTLSGSVTVGDAVSLTITMGSGLCSGAGCTVTTGPAVGGDTLNTLAGKLACAIANNASLYNLNGSSCASGVVANAIPNGSYVNGNPIGYVVIIANGVAWDFNSNISLKVTSSVSGSATEIVTIGNTTCGTRCSYTLDNNPAFQMVRQSGAAPQPGSTMAAIYSIGASSDCPSTTCVNYGSITNWVESSTGGALKASWLLQGPTGGGTWFGKGVYSNFAGSPFSTAAMADKGIGTFNAGSCYWIGATNAGGNGDSICQTANQMLLTTSGDSIVLTSAAGIGFGGAPSGTGFYSAYGGFFAGVQVPTSGTGVGINFAAGAGNVFSQNMGTSAYQPLNLSGSNIQLAPNATASGVTVTTNDLFPTTDNLVQLGAVAKRWTDIFTFSAEFYGATSGNLQMKCAAICGSSAITWPSGTTDFSATGGTSRVVKQTSAGGALTVAQLATADLSDVVTPSTTCGANTPTLAFGGASVGITYGTRSCQYVKTGKVVTVDITIVLTSKGSSVGAATFTGLPATIANAANGTCGLWAAMSGVGNGMMLNGGTGTSVSLTTSGAVAVTGLADTNFTNTSTVQCTVTFIST